jgi:hypothetical protein
MDIANVVFENIAQSRIRGRLQVVSLDRSAGTR